MSDEIVQDQPVEMPVATETEPVVVEGKPVEQPEVDETSQSSSDLPYHTKETERIAEERAKEIKEPKPEDFEYSYNGYTVKAIKPAEDQRAGTDGFLYEITQGDFKKVVMEKQDAITFVQTHSSDFAKNA